MGKDELDQFLEGDYGPKWNPPIGWGLAGSKWRECECADHAVLLSLSRPEAAFIIDRYSRDHPQEIASLIDAIVHIRQTMAPN